MLRNERSVASQPIEPSATTTRTCSTSSPSSASIQGAQVSRSAVLGLFCGGAQRTVATIRVSTSSSPSAASTEVARVASPTRCSDANSQSPERSPVKTRPVRLAPWAAGARPTMSTAGVGDPQPGIGRPQ